MDKLLIKLLNTHRVLSESTPKTEGKPLEQRTTVLEPFGTVSTVSVAIYTLSTRLKKSDQKN